MKWLRRWFCKKLDHRMKFTGELVYNDREEKNGKIVKLPYAKESRVYICTRCKQKFVKPTGKTISLKNLGKLKKLNNMGKSNAGSVENLYGSL